VGLFSEDEENSREISQKTLKLGQPFCYINLGDSPLKSGRPPVKRGNENQNERHTIDPIESKSQLIPPKQIDDFQDMKKQ
jgi:hypothetical protein